MLKSLGIVAVGGCLALIGLGVLTRARPNPGIVGNPQTQQVAGQMASGSDVTYSRVKVRYFQMSDVLDGLTEEYFSLQNPASYGDLLIAVVAAHPPLSSMMASMLVLVDGVVAKRGASLEDGDEVDFIPAISGG